MSVSQCTPSNPGHRRQVGKRWSAGGRGGRQQTENARHQKATWHADASVVADLVQAGGVVAARTGGTLVDVLLTARTRVARRAVTHEGALRVDALPAMLTGVRA